MKLYQMIGAGAVMMATWPDARVQSLLETLGPNDRRSVRRLIDEARSSGISWSEGSYVDGLSSVAAPVLDAEGCAVGAVLSYGPSYRFPKHGGRRKPEAAVSAAALAVADALAGRPL